jgi:phosphoglycerol transferase MdoB-like AlkP superfamily enzyme
MNGSIDADQKQQLAAWNKRCGKLWLKYFAVVLVPLFILMFPFFQVLNYFLAVTGPLMSGELAYGQPGYYEYQAAKDQSLITLAILLVLIAASYYVSSRWYKKAIRALGPPPGGNTSRWNRWVLGKTQDS